MKKYFYLFCFITLPLCVGGISGYFTSASIPNWYADLIKPSFNPPNYLFAPVWTCLYILMGIAIYLIWNQVSYRNKKKAYIFWTTQLFLNFCWSIIFFYLKSPGWALVEIIIMWLFILLTLLEFKKINLTAFYLMIPYILWVSFASILNASIYHLN